MYNGSGNSFNVCPRCGKANSLNAKYCSSCGKQLAVPEEVVVCPKCHKTNSPMASFCGACGTALRVGAQTKICPKCHREVDANENVCSCGYSFSGVKYATPADAANAAKADKKAAKKVANQGKKGGRLVAVFALVFLLLFGYLIFAPYQLFKTDDAGQSVLDEAGNPVVTTLRPAFLAEFDKGILFFKEDNPAATAAYGTDMIVGVIDAFKIKSEEVTPLDALKEAYGIGGLAIIAIVAVIAVSFVVQLIAYIMRIITGARTHKKNLFYLIMAILTTVWMLAAVLLGLFVDETKGEFLQKFAAIFVPTPNIGIIAYLLPVYFWFFFLYTLFTRTKKVKEAVV